jgi:hypothetical protein
MPSCEISAIDKWSIAILVALSVFAAHFVTHLAKPSSTVPPGVVAPIEYDRSTVIRRGSDWVRIDLQPDGSTTETVISNGVRR